MYLCEEDWLGRRVRIADAIDTEIHDMRHYIGREGEVIEVDRGISEEGMLVVEFDDGGAEAFWREEVEVLP